MSTVDWKDVSVVLANGETASAKACYVGDGWCDVIVNHENGTVRLWMLADGSANPPMTPCRLASPFLLTPQAPSQTLPAASAERAVEMNTTLRAIVKQMRDRADVARSLAAKRKEGGYQRAESHMSGRSEAFYEAARVIESHVAGTTPIAAERTRDAVLHAMLRAYEAEALDKSVSFMKAQDALSRAKKDTVGAIAEAREAATAATAVEVVRDMLAAHIAGVDLAYIATESTMADYKARLAGTTPLDAPPRREP